MVKIWGMKKHSCAPCGHTVIVEASPKNSPDRGDQQTQQVMAMLPDAMPDQWQPENQNFFDLGSLFATSLPFSPPPTSAAGQEIYQSLFKRTETCVLSGDNLWEWAKRDRESRNVTV
jgi:hypothetical protein